MLQALIKKGNISCEEIPAPSVLAGHILIKVVNSCISSGTELGGLKTSGESIISRAQKQPDNVKKVFDTISNEGIISAYKKVHQKINSFSPTGYSISGVIIGLGAGVNSYCIGDFVAAAGAGLANHAEIVNIPKNLVVKIPLGLSFSEASTVTLGTIAMQGVRRLELSFGEQCVVYGTGILGLLSIQLLANAGIRIAAIDIDNKRLELAKKFGAEIIINVNEYNPIEEISNWSIGFGVDAVLFTASTNDSKPLSNSFNMCKRKGKVVLVGVVGMEIDRKDIYAKELDFKISTSYGPGRYDENYEKKGNDYPYAYVRWTENRNMNEYLRLLTSGKIAVSELVSKSFSITEISQAFNYLNSSDEKPLMVILEYDQQNPEFYKKSTERYITQKESTIPILKKTKINVGIIGAGGFVVGVHLPNLARLNDKFSIRAIADNDGVNAKNIASAFKAIYSTTDYNRILQDEEIDLVMITTNHANHGDLVLKGLNNFKHVFVEKPLCINQQELDEIRKYYSDFSEKKKYLFVGYNRRFSKYACEIKKNIQKRKDPLFINYNFNAGFLPLEHKINDEGGRLIGEACHIIDLMTFFTESKIHTICVESNNFYSSKYSSNDNKSMILKYEDGSICTCNYYSTGNKLAGKEGMTLNFEGKTIILEDYKVLKGYGLKMKQFNDKIPDKGHLAELQNVYQTLTNENQKWLIEPWDLFQTSEISFAIQ